MLVTVAGAVAVCQAGTGELGREDEAVGKALRGGGMTAEAGQRGWRARDAPLARIPGKRNPRLWSTEDRMHGPGSVGLRKAGRTRELVEGPGQCRVAL